MNFSIYRRNENGLDLVNLKEETPGTEMGRLAGHGASLHAFRVRKKVWSLFNVIDNYPDLDELNREMGRSFKSPKLSPFPCRIAEGKYEHEGAAYRFGNIFSDGTAIHGLLYDKAFTITEEQAGDSLASLSLEYGYKKDNTGYPFDYNCLVRYVLHGGNLLEVMTTVTNLDKQTLPIADGWHPYFQLGGPVGDWLLQFHASAIVEFSDQLIPTGRLLQYDAFDNPRPIRDNFLHNCFVLKPGIVSPACELFNPASGLRVSFFPYAGYPYLQLSTPPSRTSIAVENLSAAPDSFNNKMGLILLPPGHSQTFTVRYKVSVG